MRLLPPRKRRPVLMLQLTAMIDIFSLIVIFLIKGTVFGVADIPVPENVKLPISVSKENVESAPQVLIQGDKVRVSLMDIDYPIELFRASAPQDSRLDQLKAKLKSFVGKMPAEVRSSGVLLNVIADRKTPYQNIFDTVRVFRQSGFETLLFVATGEGSQK